MADVRFTRYAGDAGHGRSGHHPVLLPIEATAAAKEERDDDENEGEDYVPMACGPADSGVHLKSPIGSIFRGSSYGISRLDGTRPS